MNYRQLGRSGVRVSSLCLGCWRFGEATEQSVAIRLVHEAVDAGINFIDTSNMYQLGESERIVGKALTPELRRKVVLASKVHFPMGSDTNEYGNSRRHIMQQVEDSLTRLGTDHLDLYYLHRPDPTTPPEEELRALEDLIRQGKILYAGSSHYAGWEMCRSMWVADTKNLCGFVVEQAGFSLMRNAAKADVLPCAEALGIGIVAHSPLAQGVLTGKYHAGEAPADARGVSRDPEVARKAKIATPVVERLLQVSGELDRLPEQVAIRWVLQTPAVCSTVIGPRTVEQLHSNLGAVGWELGAEHMATLTEVSTQI
ncbi:MAG: aldo/keto reductase [Spirochaetaceae bacterium]|nr:MAG: aldo/keto reductase [Spirochaetaceae bacterium]